MITLATWNVNSVRARLPVVLDWLRSVKPDVLLLQELKAEEKDFPRLEFEALGYQGPVVGQKSYNGVALLSCLPLSGVQLALPGQAPDGTPDPQARYVEAIIAAPEGGKLRVASLYLPNGNPVESGKFPYKLSWMERLHQHARALLAEETPLVLGGDFNVIPAPEDAYNPAAWAEDALFRPETRRAFRRLLHLGFTDALRALDPSPGLYTFWDYQNGCWPKDLGLRIDHFLLSPQAADRLVSCHVDRTPRGWEKASDHTPVVLGLAL